MCIVLIFHVTKKRSRFVLVQKDIRILIDAWSLWNMTKCALSDAFALNNSTNDQVGIL